MNKIISNEEYRLVQKEDGRVDLEVRDLKTGTWGEFLHHNSLADVRKLSVNLRVLLDKIDFEG